MTFRAAGAKRDRGERVAALISGEGWIGITLAAIR